MANTVKIENVLANITEENLRMEDWGITDENKSSCGTTMCFAGHAVVAAGHELRWEPGEWTRFEDAV